MEVATLARNLVLVGMMIWMCVWDIRTRLIPISAVVVICIAQAAWLWACAESPMMGVLAEMRAFASSLGVFAGLLLACAVVRQVSGREGLGGGDVKLLAALGSVFGAWGVLRVMLIACVAATVVSLVFRKGMNEPFAFCPYIAFGCLAAWALGP